MDNSLMMTDSEEGFITQLTEYINQKASKAEVDDLKRFAVLYFDGVQAEELEGMSIADLFGSLYGLWNFIKHRDDERPSLKVFNPSLEEDGWLCAHTVVLLLQKDMPFLVDSVRMEVSRQNINIHAVRSNVLTVSRDKNGQLIDIAKQSKSTKSTKSTKTQSFNQEALIYLEINLHSDEMTMVDLGERLSSVLNDVESMVDDYQSQLTQLSHARDNLANVQAQSHVKAYQHTLKEASSLLDWLAEDHFTFLGYTEYNFYDKDGRRLLRENIDKRLGLFRLHKQTTPDVFESDFNDGMKRFHLSTQVVSFTKSSVRSRVHRNAYSDYVIIKRFDELGNVIGEGRFMGLYTSPVYTLSPTTIPVMRQKIANVIDRSGLDPVTHDGKSFQQILETFPRDELFQMTESELLKVSLGVASIKERHMVRLFMRRDPYGKFLNCLVYIPRDDFSTQLRVKIQEFIGGLINTEDLQFTTYFSESLLARVHMVFKMTTDTQLDIDVKKIEQQVIHLSRSWDDHLHESLLEAHGEEQGVALYQEYCQAFHSGYREAFDARAAVQDINTVESLNDDNNFAMSFYQPIGADQNVMRFKVFHLDKTLALSEVVPILENLGLRVIGEHPYRIHTKNRLTGLSDFDLRFDLDAEIDVHSARANFQEAFAAIWTKRSDSDAFNRLVLGARLNWREVVVLRAYASYMKQTEFSFSKTYIANTLSNHLDVTRNLIALFKSSFDPRLNQGTEKDIERVARLKQKILSSLDDVDNLNEDRIIRRYLDFLAGTLRTNYFQRDSNGNVKEYMSFKFSPRVIEAIPEPRPMYEIFVYSPRVEGVHLRGSQVARGGLRWSDRLQDYRTEVLGLVKAQQVKNAVIVPSGAKGGFVAKKLPTHGTREAFMAEGIACYQDFIRGLLDITDNIIDGEVVPPLNVIRKDTDDPYMVVAADKGTATFSDIANAISDDYGHWLGDAFASGGSQGYDHKGMGITARGAWVSVQRHFKEKGVNVQEEDFTVIGIGDMSGDVFGNGMLLSQHILLTAAVNHLYIFIDPNPDSASGFIERKRLFEHPHLNWQDYNQKLISEGGGVFLRSAKSITITPEMKTRFDINADKLTPAELIHELLKAPVDLLWNGGIGTYVKSTEESHANVGDKANDMTRVNGNELRCRVFGEGGNLGMTQLGRIEYCLNGGACNTDFIDNAAGVDCSDHEVNIKILLDGIVKNGDMTQKQRNALLADMTTTVSDLVLGHNYKQTQAISLAEHQVATRVGEYQNYINKMEDSGRLDRSLEFIPDDEEIVERQQKGKSLTRPELSVLISYAKVMLKEDLAEESFTNDPYIAEVAELAFPAVLRKKYRDGIHHHRLRKEIVATQVANDMINHMGINFAHRLIEATASSPVDVAMAYVTTRDIFKMHDFFSRVEALDYQVDAKVQAQMQINMMRRMRRGARWFLRNRRGYLSPSIEVEVFADDVQSVVKQMPSVICGDAKKTWQSDYDYLVEHDVPKALAAEAALPEILYSGINIVDAARETSVSPMAVAKVYFALADELNLHWFSTIIDSVQVKNFWHVMARETFLDDLEQQMRTLAVSIIRLGGEDMDIDHTIKLWVRQHELLVGRWRSMISQLQAVVGTDYAMLSVALRELLDLAQASHFCVSLDDSSDACVLGSR